MAKQGKKLNAMRLLEKHSVEYEVFEFPDDIHSATGVAEAVGVPAEIVYKTLVVTRPAGRPLLVMVPATASLDLKALAAAVGEKKLTMAAHAEAEALTGLKVGGIGALALVQKNWDMVLDSSALKHAAILVSPGQRGINVKVPVEGLMRVLGAKTADVARDSE